MSAGIDLGRRRFLKVSAVATGGLLIGFHLPAWSRREPTTDGATLEPNAWIRISSDGAVTLLVARSEMGQGVMTSLPMLIAEELEVELGAVKVEFAPADKAYTNRLIGQQLTGGSTAIRDAWNKLREAGAVARDLLIDAAAQTWGVTADSCRAENGKVIHDGSGRQLSYGALVDKAATLPVPEAGFLKEPEEFRIIGRSLPRLDIPAKLDGSATFGMDVQVPGMLVATLLRCPVFGGTVKSFEAKRARGMSGVRHVLRIDDGIAVVADSFWQALKARQALDVTWNEGPVAAMSSAGIRERFAAALEQPAATARSEGNASAAFASAPAVIEAEYEVPYQAHACMEPMNCTADVRADGCDVWVPTQAQTRAQQTAMRLTGLSEQAVKVHTTFLGGGFGRRGEADFVSQAVQISKAAGAPVKLVWTREDDIQHDFYRPATLNRLRAALDASGKPIAWEHRIVGPSIMSRVFPNAVKDGLDRSSTEGAANLPYAIPNLAVTYRIEDPGIPVGFWRSVGSSQNAYITECFLDELAAAADKDPYEFRLALLADAPRHHGVLKLAAEAAGWGTPLPEGRYRGIAVAESFASYVAQVAEVSVSDDGDVRVHRVVCAVDCGMVVNPDIIHAQMESAIVYGLTAVLKSRITLEDGRVAQSNFHDFPLLRYDEMPEVEVHIVSSENDPGGVGEPGVPPIAPAVANAVFAATGKPVRELPIRRDQLRDTT